MNSIHVRSAATVARLIENYGFAATLSHTASPVYNPATGTATSSPTTETVMVVEADGKRDRLTGTLVTTSEKKVFMSPKVVTAPAIGDKLTLGGLVLDILAVNAASPGGLTLFYELECKR